MLSVDSYSYLIMANNKPFLNQCSFYQYFRPFMECAAIMGPCCPGICFLLSLLPSSS